MPWSVCGPEVITGCAKAVAGYRPLALVGNLLSNSLALVHASRLHRFWSETIKHLNLY